MNLHIEEVVKAVGGRLEGRGTPMVTGYSIDTRTVEPGDLFFAVKGPRFDGHDFLGQAAEKKAAAAVVEQDVMPASDSFPIVHVPSTVTALQDLARAVRRKWGHPIIGVTGSAGKTTTKELIAAVLARKFRVLRSVGNLNNEFGLPLCLLRLEPEQNIGVLEMGMSAMGEIRKLACIAEPNEGVITNVNPVHLEFFDSIDGIAEAKAELLQGLVEPRVAYLNYDDPRVRGMARSFTGKIVSYGVKTASAFRAQKVRDLGLGGTAFTVRHGRREVGFTLPLLGQHNVANALAAIAVGVSHDVSWRECQRAIGETRPAKHRGEVVRFREGFAVLDDSYNSNPRALSEMIRFLGKLKGYSRKIVVAGEMLELGPDAAALHRSCGKEATQAGCSLLIGVRGLGQAFLDGARDSGSDPDRLRFAADAQEAAALLIREVRAGDVVLVKGSRGVRLEQVLDELRSNFSGVEP